MRLLDVIVGGIVAGMVALAGAASGAPSPPAPLACLARHYAVRAVLDGTAWYAELPDGARVPYDDGREKTLAERLASPDVQDLFAQRYPRGPARAPAIDEDPGRVRLDAVLRATYPAAQLVTVELFGRRLRVHARVAEPFRRVAARLARARAADPSMARALAPFLDELGGTFAPRNIAGTDRRSAHAYGISLDLDPSRTQYWRWDRPPRWHNTVPAAIVDAFEAEGFIWGGRWYHYDTMHFEYRPELLDARCYP